MAAMPRPRPTRKRKCWSRSFPSASNSFGSPSRRQSRRPRPHGPRRSRPRQKPHRPRAKHRPPFAGDTCGTGRHKTYRTRTACERADYRAARRRRDPAGSCPWSAPAAGPAPAAPPATGGTPETLTFRQGADHHGEIPGLSRSAEEVSLLGPLRPDRVAVLRHLVSGDQRRGKGFRHPQASIESQRSLVNKIPELSGASQRELHPADPRHRKRSPDHPGGDCLRTACTASMREANPLPILFSDEKNQKGFEAAFEKIWGPMEDIEKLPPDQLDDFYRSRYRNHIAEHFPELFKLIERRTGSMTRTIPCTAAHGQPQTFGGMDAGDAWPRTPSASSTGTMPSRRSRPSKIDFPAPSPTTLDIMMAQEDLWVYETLLKVVRNTNNSDPIKDALSEADQPQSGPHQANPGDGHRQRRRSELDQLREGRCSIRWARPAAARSPTRTARQGREACKPALGRSMRGTRQYAGFGQFLAGRPLRRRQGQALGGPLRSSLTANSA